MVVGLEIELLSCLSGKFMLSHPNFSLLTFVTEILMHLPSLEHFVSFFVIVDVDKGFKQSVGKAERSFDDSRRRIILCLAFYRNLLDLSLRTVL